MADISDQTSGIGDQLLSGLDPTDWINSGILLVAAITLWLSFRAFRLQLRVTDMASCLDFRTRLADAWRRFRDAETRHQIYEFQELLNLIEAGCYLERRGLLGRASQEMMVDSLKDNLEVIFGNPNAKCEFERAMSKKSKTFIEIERFRKRYNMNYPAPPSPPTTP